ncbi:hypothetical protein [Mycolicibacterium sp. XJ879]
MAGNTGDVVGAEKSPLTKIMVCMTLLEIQLASRQANPTCTGEDGGTQVFQS